MLADVLLADVLSDAVVPDPHREPGGPGARALDRARGLLEHAAGEAAAIGGWTAGDPLRLAKGTVGWLLRCPRRALAPDGGAGNADDLVLGVVVDAAAKLGTLGARRPLTVDGTLAFLAAQGDTTAADHLADVGPAAADRLRAEAGARIDRLAAAWPALDPAWWPRVEEPVRLRLAGGAVTVTGKLDVLLGGPPTDRAAVVVEVKAGRWHDAMRADAHLYGLLVGLRDGAVPAAVVTVTADGTTQVEPVRPAVVEHAAERLDAALRTAALLAAGEVAERRPGAHCGHCPVRGDCDAGRRWVAGGGAPSEVPVRREPQPQPEPVPAGPDPVPVSPPVPALAAAPA